MEVRNRFKESDLIDVFLKKYGQRFVTLYRRQGSRPSPEKRNTERQNGCLRGLTNSCEKNRNKRQMRKRKINLHPQFFRHSVYQIFQFSSVQSLSRV